MKKVVYREAKPLGMEHLWNRAGASGRSGGRKRRRTPHDHLPTAAFNDGHFGDVDDPYPTFELLDKLIA
jgi:hypothetical protein